MKTLGVIVAALLLTGCVSLRPEAELIVVTSDATQVQACRSLGEMSSSSGWGGVVAGPGFENNRRTLQNETAERGGDTLLVREERPSYGTLVPQTFGEAYRCRP